MLNSSIVSSIQSSVCGLIRFGGSRIPPGYIYRTSLNGIDMVGLPAADLWAALPSEYRSIYFTDPADSETKKNTSAIFDAIEASEDLNDGGELVGHLLIGYAQYSDGASMWKAYRYFGIFLSVLTQGGDTLTTQNGTRIIV